MKEEGKGKEEGGEGGGPRCVAVDTRGMVYVSEEDNHRVSVFTTEGKFVTSFGQKGAGLGEFNNPYYFDVGIESSFDLLYKRL